ncbi:alpha/beta hydrolase [Aeromicrobium halocynthiae]|uniref:alpha/beta hydrolase family protein n=1 Tax=Aeromicrobium halocynthiae TaxID=560557 RepID=UPI0031DFBB9C
MQTISYGDDPAQGAELSRPDGTSRGVVVVIHGGFWRQEYDLSLGRPLAAALVAGGWTAWNLEYRRVGGGGGFPATFDDVSAGIDALADVPGLDLSTVVTLGHSAGGHLAVWAAGRSGTERWADVRVPVTAAVSQAGVLDLAAGERLGGGAVRDLLGDEPVSREVDPLGQVPLDVPVRCVHAPDDPLVPIEQSETYVAAARAAGADAALVRVDGGHFDVIDPGSDAWASIEATIADVVAR